jgi:hypothetical protein
MKDCSVTDDDIVEVASELKGSFQDVRFKKE